MPKSPQAFPRAEYLRRLSKVKVEMERRDISVLMVSAPANITYLTGYTAKSSYVPQGLIIALGEEEPYFFTRRVDAAAAMHQMFIDNSRVTGYPEDLIGNPEKDGYDAIIDFLQATRLAKGKIGLQTKLLPVHVSEKFKARIHKAKLVDFSSDIDWVRLVKSELEIAVMREAAAIADAGYLRAKEVIRPGVREADAAAEIIATLVRGANGKPATDLSSFFLCASPRSATCHIPWGEDVLREGSQVNLEFAGIRHGYTSALMRTFSIGRPSDRLLRLHEAEVAGLEAALSIIKPGVTCGEVAAAFNKTLSRHGFTKETRCGYPIGIDWMEPTASLKEGDLTIMQPNMTFHLMLGNWFGEDFGYALSETFRVTDSGVETFSKLPREIFVV